MEDEGGDLWKERKGREKYFLDVRSSAESWRSEPKFVVLVAPRSPIPRNLLVISWQTEIAQEFDKSSSNQKKYFLQFPTREENTF